MSRRFSPRLFAAAGGLLLAAVLGVILSLPLRATSRSARANRTAPGSLEARDRVAREAFFLSRRGLNFGVPPGAYRAAIARMRRQERTAVGSAGLDAPDSTQAAASLAWNALGPLPLINEIPGFGGVGLGGALAGATGRVTAVVADPTVSGRMFVGTGDGGVWMRANATAAFVPIFDLEPTLSVGALALDTTTSPDPTLYVGSGEGNGSADSYYGEGVFVSSDLGNTWTQLGASQLCARVDRLNCGRYHANAANNLRGTDLRLEREPGGRVVGRGRLQSKRSVAFSRRWRVLDSISRREPSAPARTSPAIHVPPSRW